MSLFEIDIDSEMIQKCYVFAEEIIKMNNQFNRMVPLNINRSNMEKIRIMRTFAGKLGELCFSQFLTDRNIKHELNGMFDIYTGEENVDKYDFLTRDGELIDIKTAVFPNHSRIVIPIDQFNNMPKEYYVAIKLDVNLLENKYEDIDPYKIKRAYVYGYCSHKELKNQPTGYLGEFHCKYISLNKLNNILQLVDKM